LLEETGYAFDNAELVSTIYPNPSTANNVVFCYLLTGGKKVQGQALDEQEDIIVTEHTIERSKAIACRS
jgi:ADP-ribose pyrophosphatase